MKGHGGMPMKKLTIIYIYIHMGDNFSYNQCTEQVNIPLFSRILEMSDGDPPVREMIGNPDEVEAENIVLLVVFLLLVALVYFSGLIVWVWCNRSGPQLGRLPFYAPD